MVIEAYQKELEKIAFKMQNLLGGAIDFRKTAPETFSNAVKKAYVVTDPHTGQAVRDAAGKLQWNKPIEHAGASIEHEGVDYPIKGGLVLGAFGAYKAKSMLDNRGQIKTAGARLNPILNIRKFQRLPAAERAKWLQAFSSKSRSL